LRASEVFFFAVTLPVIIILFYLELVMSEEISNHNYNICLAQREFDQSGGERISYYAETLLNAAYCYQAMACCLTEQNKEMRELLQRIKADLLMRGDEDSGGCTVVDLSS
jgi:hypothetical protein